MGSFDLLLFRVTKKKISTTMKQLQGATLDSYILPLCQVPINSRYLPHTTGSSGYKATKYYQPIIHKKFYGRVPSTLLAKWASKRSEGGRIDLQNRLPIIGCYQLLGGEWVLRIWRT